MSKGWYGNRHQHSLASKGIRVKASGVQLAEIELFPQSHQSMSFNMLKISFIDQDNPDVEDLMLIPTKNLAGELLKYTTRNGLQIRDDEGNIRDIKMSDIKMFIMLQPDVITELTEKIYGKKVKYWTSVTSKENVTEYYPSLVGKEITIESGFGRTETTGIVTKEYIEEGDSYGDNTYYNVEYENGTVGNKIYFSSISKIEGKDREKMMIYKEQFPLSEEGNL